MFVGKLVPKLLEPQRALIISSRPEDINHLSKCGDPPAFSRYGSRRLRQCVSNHFSETSFIWKTFDHEPRYSVARVQFYEAPLSRRLSDLQPALSQDLFDTFTMSRRGNKHRRIAGCDRRPDKAAYRVNQKFVVLIKLDYVFGFVMGSGQ